MYFLVPRAPKVICRQPGSDHIITSSISQSHTPACHLPADAESYKGAAAVLGLCSGFPELQPLKWKKKKEARTDGGGKNTLKM